MIPAAEVNSGKWDDVEVLFDNGQYSVISGTYYDSRKRKSSIGVRSIGVRWNGGPEHPKGFPTGRGTAQWHVEPPIFRRAVLDRVHSLASQDPSQHDYLGGIENAIHEFRG